jgi:hypothetical protein
MNRPIREAGALLAAAMAGIIALIAAGMFGFMIISRVSVGLYAAITAAAVVAAGAGAWLWSRTRFGLPKLSRSAVLALGAAYFVTWALGVPSVHTQLAEQEIAIYKRLKAEGDRRVWDVHPRIQFFVSFPVAPAIVLTYHEYSAAGLWGEGRWDLHAWYVFGIEPLVGIRTWIS